jgi:hypothetical protein
MRNMPERNGVLRGPSLEVISSKVSLDTRVFHTPARLVIKLSSGNGD